MSDNYRLAEHNVEMALEGVCVAGDNETMVRFVARDNEDNDHETSVYTMLQEKWQAAGEPQTIYVNVTAVIRTDEPANGVEVVSSTASDQMSEEEQERNPSVVAR